MWLPSEHKAHYVVVIQGLVIAFLFYGVAAMIIAAHN
jgi:phosphate starvation-inducible membrane PsiE